MRFKEFLHSEKKSELLVVTFKNSPSKEAPKLLFEELAFIEEGKTKEWGNGYSYRLDRRPDHMGGDQLHVFGRKGQAWAYRHTGDRSEPNKYKSSATNTVIDIVSDVFNIDKSDIEEALVVSASQEELLIEICFA